ncbi:YrzI family small protein, partial [Bacillus sp. AR18-7]
MKFKAFFLIITIQKR